MLNNEERTIVSYHFIAERLKACAVEVVKQNWL